MVSLPVNKGLSNIDLYSSIYVRVALITSILLVIRSIYIKWKLPKGARWLPGPPGLPIVGRVWDIPREHAYKRFKQFSDQYGPIYQINVFGVNHVWLASDKVANDLLVKRGHIYSDRPSIHNVKDTKTAGEYIPLLGHNDVWRRQRKFVHKAMTTEGTTFYQNLPYEEIAEFMVNMLDNPSNFEINSELYTGRIISRLAYGTVKQTEPIRTNSHALLTSISPAAHFTNIMPQLTKLPTWLSPWKKAEEARHARERKFFHETFSLTEKAVQSGPTPSSLLKTFFESRSQQKKDLLDDNEGAYVVGMLGLAGLLTTASVMMTYVLAMCLYPEWQDKVQEEVDRVCSGRRPELKDSPKLPILRAVIKEMIRWRPVTPTGIPHQTTADDIYEGYFIPAGTPVHPSQWAITRDSTVYPSPDTFLPERWLSPSYPTTYREPLTSYPTIQNFVTFGYGRRYCQGVDLVEQELLCAIGAMAWGFQIAKRRDGKGGVVQLPEHDYTSLLISRPRGFEFELRARSEAREGHMRGEWEDLQRERERKERDVEEKRVNGSAVKVNGSALKVNGHT